MDDYKNRLESFKNWKGDEILKVKLAMTGFYYSEVDDKVICNVCQHQFESWKTFDKLEEEHQKCPAVPMRAICSVSWMKCEKVMYPQFESTSSRKRSFTNHPSFNSARRKEFIKMGFFFSQLHECTICYHCGLGVKYWTSEENPVEVHGRFFPFCPQFKKHETTNTIKSMWGWRTQLKRITKEERTEIEEQLNLKCEVASVLPAAQ